MVALAWAEDFDAGEIVDLDAEVIYDPYGNVITYDSTNSGGVTNPFLYAGMYQDAQTGLDFLQARYYDPAVGQFVSRDPLASETRSAYAYVGDAPLDETDPAGLSPTEPTGNGDCGSYDASLPGGPQTQPEEAAAGCGGSPDQGASSLLIIGTLIIGIPIAVGACVLFCAEAAAACATAAGTLSSSEIGTGIIGWGTGQSAAAVAQTDAITANLTGDQVESWIAQGLTKDWVEDQLAKYLSAAANTTKAGANVLLGYFPLKNPAFGAHEGGGS